MFLHDPYFLIRGGLYLAACEFLYRIYSRPSGPQEGFRASWNHRIPVWLSVVGSGFFLWQIATGHASRTLNDRLTWTVFVMAAVCLAWFPGVILADEAGVEQRRLLHRRKRIAWSDVIAVNQKWEKSFLDPRSSGQRTTLPGSDGTAICFSEWSVKQDRFQWWIRNHVTTRYSIPELPKSITGNWP